MRRFFANSKCFPETVIGGLGGWGICAPGGVLFPPEKEAQRGDGGKFLPDGLFFFFFPVEIFSPWRYIIPMPFA